MIISPGAYLYLFALVVPLPFVIVALVKRRRAVYTIFGAFIFWYIPSCFLTDIFPLGIGEEFLSPFVYDGRWFGLIIKPFDSFPSGLDFFPPLFNIYWISMVYCLILGFVGVLIFKTLRKILASTIFILSFSVASALSVMMPSIILGGVNKSYDTANTIVGIPAYFVGYLAAIAVIKLCPEIAKYIDYKPQKVKREKKEKIRRRKLEISDSV